MPPIVLDSNLYIFYALTAAILGALGGGGIVAAWLNFQTRHRELGHVEQKWVTDVTQELRTELWESNNRLRRNQTLLLRRIHELETIMRRAGLEVPNGNWDRPLWENGEPKKHG